ncbi:MAG: MCP four helix bundle domain-containing protein [Clostridia bacterium]|nr:MCP four helix bundle domain-containing protein [Clostridia bacterium]
MKKSLKLKIIFAFLLMLLIFTASNVWVIISLNSLSKSIDNIMESNYRSIEAAQNMIIAIERQDSAELAHMFSQSDLTVNAFNENEKIFLTWLARAEDNITEEGESEILSEINSSYADYINHFQKMISLDSQSNSKELNDFYYNEVLPLFDKTKKASRDLLNLNQSSMLAKKDFAHATAKNATISTLFMSSISIILGLVVVTVLSNKIVKPLYDLIDKTKKISEGNYHQKLTVTGDDEIAELAKEYNIMAAKLVYYDETNINNLMEEKNKSEAIVNSISEGIIVTDDQYRVKTINQNARVIFKINSSDYAGRHLLEVIYNQALFELFKGISENPKNYYTPKYGDIEILGENGLEYFRVNVSPIKMNTGEFMGTIALIQDITKLMEVDQMKSSFVSTVSHEFRTPLTSITMSVGLLLEEISGVLSEQQRDLVEVIKEDSERLNKIVEDLLDLSKLESGKMQMDLQKHHIKDIFDYMKKLFKLQLEDIQAEMTVTCPENLSFVNIDINKITWVMSNLIGNALRYINKDGSGLIELSVHEVSGKQIVSVKDNGSGISDSVLPHVFDKFVQGNSHKGGAGLGLTICKEIVKAHGGDIWVESRLNEGTTFFFSLKTLQQGENK